MSTPKQQNFATTGWTVSLSIAVEQQTLSHCHTVQSLWELPHQCTNEVQTNQEVL